MKILLPPRKNGEQDTLQASAGDRIIVIGANGAGKSRFTQRLCHDAEQSLPVFRLSALHALYGTDQIDTSPGSIDMQYDEALASSTLLRPDLTTQLERVTALLIYQEVVNLVSYKLTSPSRRENSLPESALDDVIRTWQEIFPDNRILREHGSLSFARLNDNGDPYGTMRLSDGEKAVLYYLCAATLAPQRALIAVDAPGMFLHPSVVSTIWDRVEALRPDCIWLYTTHDFDFLTSRSEAQVVWVRSFDPIRLTWDYTAMPQGRAISEELYTTLVGTRKPVLFIEGDAKHSIDAKLYPLIFTDYTVKSLGSCNKVIEATRTFNDLNALHHLDSHGIVDRDRRSDTEVRYLRDKKIFVPGVAEIENILMLEEVIRAVARHHGKSEDKVFGRVKRAVMGMFRADLKAQALMHTRHRIKRLMEVKVDRRFSNISEMEQHLRGLVDELRPRATYQALCREFEGYLRADDYAAVLKVYNQKSMVPGSNVAALCDLNGKEGYIHDIIKILKSNGPDATRIRKAVTACFGIGETETTGIRIDPVTLRYD